MSKMREKESLECVRMHIWALKTQKLPGPLSGPWTPATYCSLRSRDSALLRRQLSAAEAGAPPWPNPGSAPDFYAVFSKIWSNNRLAPPPLEFARPLWNPGSVPVQKVSDKRNYDRKDKPNDFSAAIWIIFVKTWLLCPLLNSRYK